MKGKERKPVRKQQSFSSLKRRPSFRFFQTGNSTDYWERFLERLLNLDPVFQVLLLIILSFSLFSIFLSFFYFSLFLSLPAWKYLSYHLLPSGFFSLSNESTTCETHHHGKLVSCFNEPIYSPAEPGTSWLHQGMNGRDLLRHEKMSFFIFSSFFSFFFVFSFEMNRFSVLFF